MGKDRLTGSEFAAAVTGHGGLSGDMLYGTGEDVRFAEWMVGCEVGEVNKGPNPLKHALVLSRGSVADAVKGSDS